MAGVTSIVALAVDEGLVIHGNDTDFALFPKVECVDPVFVELQPRYDRLFMVKTVTIGKQPMR